MKNVCISVDLLFHKFGEKLTYCTIQHTSDDMEDYYDIYNAAGLVCCDGEECEVVKTDGGNVTLRSTCDDVPARFMLTNAEFQVASIN